MLTWNVSNLVPPTVVDEHEALEPSEPVVMCASLTFVLKDKRSDLDSPEAFALVGDEPGQDPADLSC